jgi:hypothetical protein
MKAAHMWLAEQSIVVARQFADLQSAPGEITPFQARVVARELAHVHLAREKNRDASVVGNRFVGVRDLGDPRGLHVARGNRRRGFTAPLFGRLIPKLGKMPSERQAHPFPELEDVMAGGEEERRRWIRFGRIGIDHRQQSHLLAELAQSLRDREGDHSAKGMAAELIRAVRLNRADLLRAENRELLQRERGPRAVEERIQKNAVKRLVVP